MSGLRAVVSGLLGGVLAGTALLPVAAAEPAPTPQGFTPSRSTVTVYTAWETHRSTVTKFFTDPQQVAKEDLEDALGATNEVVTLSDRFLFDFGSAALRPSAAASLDTVAALLAETGGPVEVTGHTDNIGADSVNQPLSEDRAKAVADYLTSKGIEAARITSSGKGASEPVADNTHSDGRDNPEGRQQNRRVEIAYSNS